VLIYHGIGDQPASFGERYYTIAETEFAKQLRLLAERPVVPLPWFVKGQGPPGAAVITFDDGERSVVDTALPLLEARGWVGTVFVTTAWIGRPGYLKPDDLRLLARKGWTIGTHGATHRFLSDLSDADLRQELDRSRETLTRILGRAPEHLSLPGGRGSERVQAAARAAGYVSLCTSEMGLNSRPPQLWRIRRIMVVRPWDLDRFRGFVSGDRLLYWRMEARQQLFAGAKRALGNKRYVRLRARAFDSIHWALCQLNRG